MDRSNGSALSARPLPLTVPSFNCKWRQAPHGGGGKNSGACQRASPGAEVSIASHRLPRHGRALKLALASNPETLPVHQPAGSPTVSPQDTKTESERHAQ